MNSNYNFLNKRLGSQFNRKKLEQSERKRSFSSNSLSLTWLWSLVLMLSFLMGQGVMAQVSNYTFSQSTGTYSALVSPTVLGSGAALDNQTYNISAGSLSGFTFNLNGTNYTAFTVSANGFMGFGSSLMGGAVYTPLSTTSGGNVFAAPYADDLGGLSASTQISWKLEGTAPNRELVIEWSNIRNYNKAGVDLSFQVRLQETVNVVKFVYGTMTYTSTTSDAIQVGLKSSTTAGHYINRTTTSNWNSTTAGGSNSATCSVLNTVTMPVSGLTFTWTPLVMSPCTTPTALPTALLFNSVTATSLNGSFTAASPAPSKYLVVRSTSATAPTPSNGTVYTVGSTALGAGTNVRLASNATTFSDSGLTAGTQYYYYVFSYNDLCTGEPFYSTTALSGSQNTLCATGTSLGSNNILLNSANITWTGSGNYIVEYGLTGFTPGTGATAGAGGTIASSTATSPYALTGLSPSTTYQVYVRQVCPLGGYGLNSSSTSFSTACTPITVFPSTFDFASYLPSACWREGDLGDAITGPTTIGGSSVSDWVVDGFLNVGSTGAAKMNIDAANGSEWLITPFYTIPATGYRVKYSVGATQWNATTALTTPWEEDDFVEFLVSTSNTNWTVLKTYNSANVPSHLGQIDDVDLSAYNGQTVQFAFRAFEGASNGGADIDFFIDNFIVEQTPVLPPNCATGLLPADLATEFSRTGTLTWSAATGSPNSYDVYFGTSANPSFVANVSGLSYVPGAMVGNTTYFWKIVPKNNNGDAIGCVEQSFTTTADFVYCSPTYSNGAGTTDGIVNVTLNTLNNTTTQNNVSPYYTFYNAVTVPSIQQGNTASVSVTFGSDGNQYAGAWIDFNQNGIFETSEGVVSTVNAGANGITTLVFNVPMDAQLGNTRMRVRGGNDSALSTTQACGASSSGYGETEDYIVNILAMPTDTPDYVNLQFPGSATILVGESVTVYARVYEGGLTDTTSGQASGIQAWIGISPVGADASSNPNTWTTWVPATFNVETDGNNNDEYQATIGSTLPVGTYRYASRFRLNGGPFVYGGYEFNEWNGTTSNSGVLTVNPNPTQCATLLSPVNGATNVPVGSLTLSWAAPTSGPAPTGYKLYAGTTSGSLSLVTTTANLTTNVNITGYNTTFYWQIVPTSAIGGDAVGCGEFSFTTESDPFAPYCSNIVFSSSVEPITSVNFAGIDNQSSATINGTPALQNFISLSGNVTAGESYTMTLKGNTGGDWVNNFRVFIDWNQDGDFDDAGETYNAGTIEDSDGLDAIQAVSNIVVPSNALAGTTRMRVKKIFGLTNVDNSCLGAGFGQFEDYSLIVSLNWYADLDNDGFGNSSSVLVSVTQPVGYVAVGGDCNDENNTVYPGATEICYDGLDNDCNGTIDDGCTPIVTVVQPSQCGITLAAVNSYVYANIVSGAQGYRFRVTNLSTNQVQSIDQLLRAFRITQLTNYAFNTTYSVEVSVRINNVWQPFYGTPCNVSTPDTTTQIQASQCNTTLSSVTNTIFADIVPFATGYRFRVTNTLNPVDVQTIDRPIRDFKMTSLSSFQYNTMYNVEVAVRNTDGTYLSYGPVCNITTPLFPTIGLQDAQCDEYQVSSYSETLFAESYSGAQQYRFLLENLSQPYSQTFDRPIRTVTLNNFTGLLPGTTYTVRVAIQLNGVWGPYGKSCSIITPGGARSADEVSKVDETSVNEFKAIAYPNPFATSFAIDVRTSNTEKVSLTVYDMTGRLLESNEVNAADATNYQFGDRYPSGVYNVIVTQGEETRTVRVVKQ